MKNSTPPDCSHCNDTGFEADEWASDYCEKGCAAAEMCASIDSSEKAYSHAERCFTDHGYARGN